MGVFSNKITTDQLKPGDHIYSWRRAYIYSHHGIYIGDEKVIHFTRGGGQEIGTRTVLDCVIFSCPPSNSTGIPCPNCGDQSRADGVISSCLECFLSGGNLYRFEYGVPATLFIAKLRGGTCTQATCDPPEDVIHRASFLLENGFGEYDISKNNCETFAMYCKTGLLVFTSLSVRRSGQACSILNGFRAVVSSPLIFSITSVSGLTAVNCEMYCVSQYISDIGVRRDRHKLAVEGLVAVLREVEVSPDMAMAKEN